MPRRLIDVGTGAHEVVRLHIVTGEEKDTSYAALSHCCGPNAGMTTILVSGNLERMTQGIQLETMAKNFQDALTITRGLHLRYLWIDALCIIQDSVEGGLGGRGC